MGSGVKTAVFGGQGGACPLPESPDLAVVAKSPLPPPPEESPRLPEESPFAFPKTNQRSIRLLPPRTASAAACILIRPLLQGH